VFWVVLHLCPPAPAFLCGESASEVEGHLSEPREPGPSQARLWRDQVGDVARSLRSGIWLASLPYRTGTRRFLAGVDERAKAAYNLLAPAFMRFPQASAAPTLTADHSA
jgi:hypothetical protein